ncbi:XRE family transcriptional regulator [Macrococcus brunensis]|uniref:XRE family transcriptional regulator n=1 Tax=Macrococcus brunensis TaxID=198483 RepID=A0A4R6BFX0_9STAP|nr:XRE family transcriptional regulator [Macrococcus brunensis]
MNNTEIMEAIKYHRENLGYTSTEVAEVIGYSVSKYSRLENHKQPILGWELLAIARYFGMSVEELTTIPKRKR